MISQLEPRRVSTPLPPQRGTATCMASGGEESSVFIPLNQLRTPLAVEASRSPFVPRAVPELTRTLPHHQAHDPLHPSAPHLP